MEYLQNLHTHSTYDDGRDTLKEMIEKALEKGFCSIGFSGHSYMPFAPEHSMSVEGTKAYVQEVRTLQEQYRGKIEVFCGIERELYSELDLSEYDYVIGSAHYFKFGNEYVGFDRNGDCVSRVIDEYFHGDGLAYAKAYYELLATLPERGRVDILGHFDLIAKHVEQRDFFDQNDKRYLEYAYGAIDALQGKVPVFEMNTGAIARGYRTTPYPHIPILKRLLERGFLPTISSDCHDKNNLDVGFEDCVELLKACGAKARYVLTKDGFQGVKL